MFSFFEPGPPFLITANQIIDLLEYKALDISAARDLVRNQFGVDRGEKHGNTLLLSALAWNRLKAASILLELDEKKIALNITDSWPTCKNTPLVLAAKINATEIIKKLITLGAKVNTQDYRGFTALHYACMLRNDVAIKVLLDAKADVNLCDAFGHTPAYYYQMEITENDLAYRYGTREYAPQLLAEVYDDYSAYFATNKKCLSALRWYVQHIVVNDYQELSGELDLMHPSYMLRARAPIFAADLYGRLMQHFCKLRPVACKAIEKLLTITLDQNNPYTADANDRYRLSPTLFIPRGAAHKINGEIWVEMQTISKRPG